MGTEGGGHWAAKKTWLSAFQLSKYPIRDFLIRACEGLAELLNVAAEVFRGGHLYTLVTQRG